MSRFGQRWVFLAGAIACLAAEAAQAAVGRVLYSIGTVEIRRAGAVLVAERGSAIEVRDEIAVGPKARAQLRMADGSLLALQPGSSLVVDEFSFPGLAAQGGATDVGTSVLRLLKGGLRTITGLIGKRGGDTYKVNTHVATIGVRGTDYRMALCQGDCGATPDGLYLGVSAGSVIVSNPAGQLFAGDNEFVYVSDANSPPQRLLQPPSVLETVLQGGPGGEPPSDAGLAGGPTDSDDCHCVPPETDPGYRDVVHPDRLMAAEGVRAVAHATSSPAVAPVAVGAGIDPVPPSTLDAEGRLTSFQGLTGSGVEAFQIGGGSIGNVGFDPATGMRWGRWSEAAQIGGTPVNLANHDLHWIAGADSPALFALPISGSATYDLVGNTNPTDNHGNVGFLGSATLTANFSSQTLTNTLNLSINNQAWNATGTASLHSPLPLFGGNYSSVTVNGQGGGAGSFAGFFVPGTGGQALPAGAGLTYNLNSGDTTVTGAAAFGAAPP